MATSSGSAGRHAFSELYARWALNPLVDVAQAVAHDVAVRPHLYRALEPHIVECIAGFRHRVGTSPEWPDAFQRTLSFKPLYQVSVASPPIRAAAIHCANEPESAPLLDQFRETVKVFSDHLRGFTGDALNMLCEQSRPIFEQAACLLQSEAVANAFGVKPAPQRDWPLGVMASNGAILVSTIAQTLKGTRCLVGSFRRLSRDSPIERRLAPGLMMALPVEKVLSLQRAAHWGAKTLDLVLADDEVEDVQDVVSAAYQWAKALQPLVPDAPRAWKDIEYRSTLTDLEWGMAPNPAGVLGPGNITPTSRATYTASGEVCCSSGDLDCDPTSVLTDFCTEFCKMTFNVIHCA